MEQVHPALNLAGAMAISAAAASPNMGRSTNPLLVSFMVLLNIRLGYWLSNPGRLEEALAGRFGGADQEQKNKAGDKNGARDGASKRSSNRNWSKSKKRVG